MTASSSDIFTTIFSLWLSRFLLLLLLLLCFVLRAHPVQKQTGNVRQPFRQLGRRSIAGSKIIFQDVPNGGTPQPQLWRWRRHRGSFAKISICSDWSSWQIRIIPTLEICIFALPNEIANSVLSQISFYEENNENNFTNFSSEMNQNIIDDAFCFDAPSLTCIPIPTIVFELLTYFLFIWKLKNEELIYIRVFLHSAHRIGMCLSNQSIIHLQMYSCECRMHALKLNWYIIVRLIVIITV